VQSRRGSILALVLAGGEGGRLGPLTEDRAKPSLPFAGVYRLIDFPLSNCHHSRISDVWVVQQYEPHSLADHLSNGRPWDLDRTFGGLRVLHPSTGDEESGFYEGNADAIQRNREPIAEFEPETVLVVSADAVYKLDYQLVLERHRDCDAEVTMVTTTVPRDEAGRFGVVEADGGGRVTGFEYKPDEPRSDVVTTEVFAYDARVLLDTLAELAEGDDGLQDFGHELLPRLVERGRAFALDLGGYWRDVGTIESYWQGHMDLLDDDPRLDLGDPEWPILTHAAQRPPALVEATAAVDRSLVSPGCRVAGRVVRSVLGPGAVVEEGAEVVESVVLDGARVRAGATVRRAIVDAGCDVAGEEGGAGEIEVVSG
jgi:glucose-1-phosphate adenylyltransferase